MLAFVMLWAYFSFSQYLIIWSGNLPRGDRLVPAPAADRLARRRRCALIVFHFAVPFVLLLSRRSSASRSCW